MFDYIFAEQAMPYVLCPECNCKMSFHGSWYPKEVICQNCGCEINLVQALKILTYPNRKYNKDGRLDIREERNVIKDESNLQK